MDISIDHRSQFDRQLKHLITCFDALAQRLVLRRAPATTSDLDLSRQESKMLMVLGAKGVAIMRDLAGALNLPLSTATNTIDKLVAKAVVERTRVDEDRRIVQVALTAKGQQLYQSFLDCQLAMARGMLEALSPGEREIFLELMAKMTAPKQHSSEPDREQALAHHQ